MMEERFSLGQKKALSDFFNTVAAAWFTAGIVAPFFSIVKVPPAKALSFPVIGITMAYVFLYASLFFAEEVT